MNKYSETSPTADWSRLSRQPEYLQREEDAIWAPFEPQPKKKLWWSDRMPAPAQTPTTAKASVPEHAPAPANEAGQIESTSTGTTPPSATSPALQNRATPSVSRNPPQASLARPPVPYSPSPFLIREPAAANPAPLNIPPRPSTAPLVQPPQAAPTGTVRPPSQPRQTLPLAAQSAEQPPPADSPVKSPGRTKPTREEIRARELERIAVTNGELPKQIYRRTEPWGNDLTQRDYAFTVKHGMYVDGQAYPLAPEPWKQRWAMSQANLLGWRPLAPRPGFENQPDGGWSPRSLGAEMPAGADANWLQREHARASQQVKNLESALGYVEPRELYVRDPAWFKGLGSAQSYAIANQATIDGRTYAKTDDIREQHALTPAQVEAWKQLPLARARLVALEDQLEDRQGPQKQNAEPAFSTEPNIYQKAQGVGELVKAADQARKLRGNLDSEPARKYAAERESLRRSGLSDHEIERRANDYRAFDFSRGHDAARLSTGEVIVNPDLALEPQKWRAALDKLGATPDEIKRAMAARLEMREDLAVALEGVASQSGAYRDFLKQLAKEQNREGEYGTFSSTTPGMRMEEFYKRTGTGFGNVGTQVYQSLRGSNARMGQGLYGALDALTGGEVSTFRDLADTARETAENAEGIMHAVRGGLWARALAKGTAMAHGILSEAGLGAAGPFVGMAIEKGAEHNEMLNQGKTRSEANWEAVRSTARDAATEYALHLLKLDKLFRAQKNTLGSRAVQKALKDFVEGAGRSTIRQTIDQLTDPNAGDFSGTTVLTDGLQNTAEGLLRRNHEHEEVERRRADRRGPTPPPGPPPTGGGNPPPPHDNIPPGNGNRREHPPGGRRNDGGPDDAGRQRPQGERGIDAEPAPRDREQREVPTSIEDARPIPKHDAPEATGTSPIPLQKTSPVPEPLPKVSPEVNEAFLKLPEVNQRIFLGLNKGRNFKELAAESGLTEDAAAKLMDETTAALRDAGVGNFSAHLERPKAEPAPGVSDTSSGSVSPSPDTDEGRLTRAGDPVGKKMPSYEEIIAHPSYQTLKPREKLLFDRLQHGVPPKQVQQELGLSDEGFRYIRYITGQKLKQGGAFDMPDGDDFAGGGGSGGGAPKPEPVLAGGGQGSGGTERAPTPPPLPSGGGARLVDDPLVAPEEAEHDVFASPYAPTAAKADRRPLSAGKPAVQSPQLQESPLPSKQGKPGGVQKGPQPPRGKGGGSKGWGGGQEGGGKNKEGEEKPTKSDETSDEEIFNFIQASNLDEAERHYTNGDRDRLADAYARHVQRLIDANGRHRSRKLVQKKPENSPNIQKWLKNKGSFKWSDDGTWEFTDREKNTVRYPDGFPDFAAAGFVTYDVTIEYKSNPTADKVEADRVALSKGYQRGKGKVWHHYQDMKTMQEVDAKIHSRFTHIGGRALFDRKMRAQK
jgi:hypothetical protein